MLRAAVEENVAGFLLELGLAGDGVERRDDEVAWTVGGSPIGYHNAVVRFAAGSPARADALVQEWLGELGSRRLPGSVHVTPAMRPSDLVDRLVAAGFVDGGEEPAMAADLRRERTVVTPTQLRIDRVEDEAALRDYRDVLAAGFGEGPKEADWVAEVYGRLGFDDTGPWHHHVGRLDGEPVCTATSYLSGDVAGIYFVATTPDARRQGFGAAITHHTMVDARRRGAATAILGSSPMGHELYRRLGFADVFAYRLLEWEPAR